MDLSQEDLLRLQAAQFAQLLLQARVLLVHVQPQAVSHGSGPVQLDDCGRNTAATPLVEFPAKAQEIVLQEAVSRDSVPVISRCMELSMGSGRDRKLKGSKRALMCPHVLHFTWDLSWPWKRSTTMERFLRRWFSHACGGGHTNTRRRRRLQQDPCGRRRWAAAARAAR